MKPEFRFVTKWRQTMKEYYASNQSVLCIRSHPEQQAEDIGNILKNFFLRYGAFKSIAASK